MTLQVGVKAFLKNNEGKYLLLKRNADKYITNGAWDIVGGRIEPGTPLLENLKREVLEETQLKVTSEPKLIFAQDIILNSEKHIVRLTFIADAVGEVILDTSENTEYKWLDIEEMKTHEDLDAYVKEVLKEMLVG